jgi:hypothetical protein
MSSVIGLLAAQQAGAVALASNSASASTASAATEQAVAPTSDRSGDDGVDFTNITPAEMHDVAQKMFEAGEIDLTQLLMLQTAGMPLGKLGPNGEFQPLSDAEKAQFANTPRNYLEISQDAMAFLEQTGKASDPTSGYKLWQGIFETLQNGTAGVDVMA